MVIAHAPDPNRERNQRAAAAVATLQSATDPISVAVRGALSYAFTLLNDEREARSLPRLTEQQIYSGIVGFIAGGAGEPTPNPIAPIGG